MEMDYRTLPDKGFEIYLTDLTDECQERFLAFLREVGMEDHNYDVFPITEIWIESQDDWQDPKDDGFDHRAAQHGGLGMDECVLWNLGHHVLGEDLLEEEAPEPRHHISCVANPHFCDRHMEVLERRRSSAK